MTVLDPALRSPYPISSPTPLYQRVAWNCELLDPFQYLPLPLGRSIRGSRVRRLLLQPLCSLTFPPTQEAAVRLKNT